MKTHMPCSVRFSRSLGLALCLCAPVFARPSLKTTIDGIVTRLYADLNEEALSMLSHEKVLGLITKPEREVLATKYWYFNVNVPVIVSVIRDTRQFPVPFWLPEAGFVKTDLVVKNEIASYEVWQKRFGAGHVELGINGLDMHRPVYFVCVGPQEPGEKVTITDIFPSGEAVRTMKKGAWTYRDWSDLYIEDPPLSLAGQILLTTYRGRAREAHLVGAFRKTPFPSSSTPDHVVLTWSRDPRTTQTIQWRTNTTVNRGIVRYREQHSGTQPFVEAPAECRLIEDRLLMNDRYIHQHTAVLGDLKPSTAYTYTVGSPDNDQWSDQSEFRTAPDAHTPFSFVYFGDTHRSPDWGRLLTAADQRHPEIAFYTISGDVVSTGLFRDDWDRFFQYASGVFNRKPLAFSLGNHDDQDGLGAWMPLALVAFPENGPSGVEPERTYSFRYGNALFLVMDVGTSHEAQATWMDKQMADTDATWKLVIYHFPLYCPGEDEEYAAIRRRWEQVFEKYHVDMMLTGHVHYYLRTHPMKYGQPVDSPADGTIHVISLGIPSRDRSRGIPGYVVKSLSGGPWYQKFDINGNRLVYRAFDKDCKVCDEFIIRK